MCVDRSGSKYTIISHFYSLLYFHSYWEKRNGMELNVHLSNETSECLFVCTLH